MKKIKILFFLPNLEGGGAERVSVNIINKLDKNQFDVSLALVKLEGEYLENLAEHVNVINLNSSRIAFSIFKLRKVIDEIDPEIVFSSLFTTNIILYFSILLRRSVPKLILRSPNSPELVLKNNEMSLIVKKLLELAYQKANYVLAQTPEMKKEIVNYHHINKNKIIVFTNPLDTKYIDSQIKNIKNPFSEETINIVASGRLHKQKGFDILIKAFKEVYMKNNNFRLYVIGNDKGEKERLIKLINKLELNEYVKLLGFQKNPYRYYYYSDLYVLSSRWEGLPNTVLENLYLNKPIVSTRCIPYMEKLIDDDKNGFLIEIDDIQEMSRAILKFKELSPSPQDRSVDIDKLFLDMHKGDI